MKIRIFLSIAILTGSCMAFAQNNARNIHCTVSNKPETIIESVGTELDPHFFSANVARNEGVTAEDWNIVKRRVKLLGITGLRVMVLPEWYEQQNDNDDADISDLKRFTFDTPEMKSLYAVLDLAQQYDIAVTIVLWGAPIGTFLAGSNTGNWVVAPADTDEWCENFSVLIRHLINDLRYTCVKEITPVNEPDWSYVTNGKPAPVSEYITMCHKLNERFRRDGIRNKVRFNLSDNTDGATAYLEACGRELSDVADKFSSHTYAFGYDTPDSVIYKWERRNVLLSRRAGKPHFVGEFGSNQTVGSTRQRDINCYERGILMSRIVLNALNAGASGVSYWSLIDQYYGRDASYADMQQLGLWRHLKKTYAKDSLYADIDLYGDYTVRPQFYAYGLLANFIRPGDKVFPLKTDKEFVTASAFRDKSNKWTYIIANATNTVQDININNAHLSKTKRFDVYEYTRTGVEAADKANETLSKSNDTAPVSDATSLSYAGIKPSRESTDIFSRPTHSISSEGSTLSFTVPPASVVVCTQI